MPRGIRRVAFFVLLSAPATVAQLPPEIQADRYLLTARQAIERQDFAGAQAALDKMSALETEQGLKLPEAFYFRSAQVAQQTHRPARAVQMVMRYLEMAGRDGAHYTEALELLNAAEAETFNAAQTCQGKPKGAACWMELADHPGCYVWNSYLEPAATVTWTEECAEGLAQGTGTLKWVWDGGGKSSEGTGRVQAGKLHGRWILRNADGNVWEGMYEAGRRHGQWVLREKDGDLHEGPIVNEKWHGDWVQRWANGGVWEGSFVEGKRHGDWVLGFPNGQVEEGPFVEGKRDGQWTIRPVDGDVWMLFLAGDEEFFGTGEGSIVDGKRHGTWVIRAADGDVAKGPFVEGKLHGRWIWRKNDGLVWKEGSYKEGKKHGQWLIRFKDESWYGQIKSLGSYKKGEKHGKWVEIYAIATKKGEIGTSDEGSFVNGKRHGQWTMKSVFLPYEGDAHHSAETYDYNHGKTTPLNPDMVVIPGGQFRMGCVSGRNCQNDETPVHEVTVGTFALSKYEVTSREYFRFRKEREPGYQFSPSNLPADLVSWEDAVAYTKWLSERTGERYRLPSEAEWEYSARAGSKEQYSWGRKIGRNRAQYCKKQGRCPGSTRGGSFRPNAWGLYDMHGNVPEWVQDCWNGNYQGAPTDGSAWENGDCSQRVVRGGSGFDGPRDVRSATRRAKDLSEHAGFRVARDVTP